MVRGQSVSDYESSSLDTLRKETGDESRSWMQESERGDKIKGDTEKRRGERGRIRERWQREGRWC